MTANTVSDFIAQIWNKQAFYSAGEYLHPDFTDHSLPDTFAPGVQGLLAWIQLTSASFEHLTVIDQQVTEGDMSVVKITMHMTHTGPWRNIAPTGKVVRTTGYRMFRLKEGKIIEHWGMVDGNALEQQLAGPGNEHACKIAR